METWSIIELQKLKRFGRTSSIKELAIILDRSYSSVHAKLIELKIDYPKRFLEWTVEEEELVKKLLKTGMKAKEIQKSCITYRSYIAIKRKIQNMRRKS